MRNLLVFCAVLESFRLFAADSIPVQVLKPQILFSLPAAIHTTPWNKLFVREMRSSRSGLWFLIDSKESRGASAIVHTTLDGTIQGLSPAQAGTSFTGLAITSVGAATVAAARGQGALAEYDDSGRLFRTTPVPCWGGRKLLAVDGLPSTVCADGTITTYGAAHPKQVPSWIRAGSDVALAGNQRLAIVDRATGKILIQDLRSGKIWSMGQDVPDIDAATEKNSTAQTQAS